MSEVVEQVLLREVIPGSVLVNEDREILYLYGNVSSYLQLSGGEPSRKLEDLVPPTLRQRLKSALKTVTQERTRVSLDGMMVRDGVNRQLRLSVRPVVLENEHPCLSLVTFEELESSKAEATTPPQAESVLIAQLENELRATREDLQSTISDLETSNEEFRSSHEEINSMNEELQSSNEELETSKEELQSLNEELTTVNAELQENVTMHEELSDDLNNLITSSGIATIFLDTDLRIKGFTTASCRIMNLIETDRGRSISDVTKRFHDESIQLDCENVLRSRSPSEKEIKLIDGSWFLQRILPYRSINQTVEGVVITFTEITGVKRTEERERLLAEKLAHGQKLEALGLLAGGVAHDFNNILTALIGHAELGISDRDVSEKTKQRFQGIVQAGGRAKEIIRQILLFSRSDEEKKTIVNVSQVLREALTLIRASIPATVQIQHSIEDSSLCILGDPARLHQVLMNLCTNASHAIGAAPGHITVTLSAVELLNEGAKDKSLPPGRYLLLSVTDSGSGIPLELQPRIFEPFFTTKSQTGGTGMGLSVVHGIVTSFGGKIEVKSQVGGGSTFEIFLPRVGQSVISQKPGSPPPVQRGAAHILLVDDEEAILSLVQELFEVSGYTVTAVGDPTVAKDLFTQNPQKYAILVTDQSMPKMTGVNLILALRAIRPELPVILTSGFSADLTPDVMEQLGVHTFLSKPYQFAELAAVLAAALPSADETNEIRSEHSS
jgi:signal transduction histidine kinase/CheY-like chemotaxis protein